MQTPVARLVPGSASCSSNCRYGGAVGYGGAVDLQAYPFSLTRSATLPPPFAISSVSMADQGPGLHVLALPCLLEHSRLHRSVAVPISPIALPVVRRSGLPATRLERFWTVLKPSR